MSCRTTEPDRTYNYVTMSQSDLIPLNQSCEVPTIRGELDERVHGPGSSTKLQGIFQRFVFVFFGIFVTCYYLSPDLGSCFCQPSINLPQELAELANVM